MQNSSDLAHFEMKIYFFHFFLNKISFLLMFYFWSQIEISLYVRQLSTNTLTYLTPPLPLWTKTVNKRNRVFSYRKMNAFLAAKLMWYFFWSTLYIQIDLVCRKYCIAMDISNMSLCFLTYWTTKINSLKNPNISFPKFPFSTIG